MQGKERTRRDVESPALEDNTGGCRGDIDTYINSINWDKCHKSKECSKNTGSFRIELSKKIKSHKGSQDIYKQATSTEQNKNNILVIWGKNSRLYG